MPGLLAFSQLDHLFDGDALPNLNVDTFCSVTSVPSTSTSTSAGAGGKLHNFNFNFFTSFEEVDEIE